MCGAKKMHSAKRIADPNFLNKISLFFTKIECYKLLYKIFEVWSNAAPTNNVFLFEHFRPKVFKHDFVFFCYENRIFPS